MLSSHLLIDLHHTQWVMAQFLKCREVDTFVPKTDIATTSSSRFRVTHSKLASSYGGLLLGK